jgi:hypothetical protein
MDKSYVEKEDWIEMHQNDNCFWMVEFKNYYYYYCEARV